MPQRMPARPLKPGEAPPKGTAVLKGQVLAASGGPIRRAQVRAMSMEGRGGGVTSTDAEAARRSDLAAPQHHARRLVQAIWTARLGEPGHRRSQ